MVFGFSKKDRVHPHLKRMYPVKILSFSTANKLEKQCELEIEMSLKRKRNMYKSIIC